MERPVKIMLAISVVLLAVYAAVLFNDYSQFQSSTQQIMLSLKSSEPYKLQAAWFTIVVLRSVEFLAPSLILGFAAIVMHVRDTRKPKSRVRD